MPRALRIEYPGAVYHVMCRGDRREAIFLTDVDRTSFLETLGQACEKTGWRVHAYVLMPNHYHLVVETPEPNLVAGMRWLQSTYTIRFNSRNRMSGHLFQGRYKAVVVDAESAGYLGTVSTYVHLNPVRAKMIPAEKVRQFAWSSARWYGGRRARPSWLCLERVLGSFGWCDAVAGRRCYQRYLVERAREELGGGSDREKAYASIRRGWCLGGEEFREALLERMGEASGVKIAGRSVAGAARSAYGEYQAQRLIAEELGHMGATLSAARKWRWTDPRKRRLVHLVRSRTTVTNAWVGSYFGGGDDATVSRASKDQE